MLAFVVLAASWTHPMQHRPVISAKTWVQVSSLRAAVPQLAVSRVLTKTTDSAGSALLDRRKLLTDDAEDKSALGSGRALPIRELAVGRKRAQPEAPQRVLVLGASGYIGSAVVRELVSRGHQVVAIVRQEAVTGPSASTLSSAELIIGDVGDASTVAAAFAARPIDAVVSCVSSRSGSVDEVWRVDYGASRAALDCLQRQVEAQDRARDSDTDATTDTDTTADTVITAATAAATAAPPARRVSYVLLSAICVRTPVLELHRAKLAMEQALADSPVSYAIVRPSAYFKSLAGQVSSLLKGQPYILFGDGTHTRSNAMSDADVARVLVDCMLDADELNGVVEIGGGEGTITPLEQSRMLFELLGREPEYLNVPLNWLDNAVGVFDGLARALPPLRDAAEAARIARFYATQEMVGPPHEDYARDSLKDYYASMVAEGRLKLQQEARDGGPDLGLPTTSLLALNVLQAVRGARRMFSRLTPASEAQADRSA
mmetsp:Transcript_53979/g.117725  ORF Transcript_53979/g.117725 Transcript_53979/m.117725 type:complete len:488 (+) Transcript_53979:144-1607(+)